MKCYENECDGEVNLQGSLITFWRSRRCVGYAIVCPKCGRLYWRNGKKASTLAGRRVFLKEGKVIKLDENGKVIKAQR